VWQTIGYIPLLAKFDKRLNQTDLIREDKLATYLPNSKQCSNGKAIPYAGEGGKYYEL
jgi:hypothetical protein